MGIELKKNYVVVNDETGLQVGMLAIDIDGQGVGTWTAWVDNPPPGHDVEGVCKQSPAGHYRLMDGNECVGTVSDALAVNGPEAGEDSPWGGPATLT